ELEAEKRGETSDLPGSADGARHRLHGAGSSPTCLVVPQTACARPTLEAGRCLPGMGRAVVAPAVQSQPAGDPLSAKRAGPRDQAALVQALPAGIRSPRLAGLAALLAIAAAGR